MTDKLYICPKAINNKCNSDKCLHKIPHKKKYTCNVLRDPYYYMCPSCVVIELPDFLTNDDVYIE